MEQAVALCLRRVPPVAGGGNRPGKPRRGQPNMLTKEQIESIIEAAKAEVCVPWREDGIDWWNAKKFGQTPLTKRQDSRGSECGTVSWQEAGGFVPPVSTTLPLSPLAFAHGFGEEKGGRIEAIGTR